MVGTTPNLNSSNRNYISVLYLLLLADETSLKDSFNLLTLTKDWENQFYSCHCQRFHELLLLQDKFNSCFTT